MTLFRTFLLGSAASACGALGLVSLRAGSLAFPSAVDAGQMRLFSETSLLIPVTNSSHAGVIRLSRFSTSCGCASVDTPAIDVGARTTGFIGVRLKPSPPQDDVSVWIHFVDSLEREHSIHVIARVLQPFAGYPMKAVGTLSPDGVRVAFDHGATPSILRAEAYSGSTNDSYPCWIDDQTHAIFIGARDVSNLDLVLWTCSGSTPAWSGPVEITRPESLISSQETSR